MGFDDRLHNGEAKARVLRLSGGAGFVGPIEAVEDVRKVFGGNAGTVVPDGQDRAVVLLLGGNINMTLSVTVVMDGVTDEIGDDGCNGRGVAGAKHRLQICAPPAMWCSAPSCAVDPAASRLRRKLYQAELRVGQATLVLGLISIRARGRGHQREFQRSRNRPNAKGLFLG